MPDPTVYYIPRRRFFIAPYIATDDPIPKFEDIGVINSGELTFSRENNEYRANDFSGDACREYVADANTVANSGTFTAEFMSADARNLGLMLSSAVTTHPTGPATTENCPEPIAVGDVVRTNFIPDPDTLVVTDSDASPATLVLGTHYEYVVKKTGTIRFLDLAAFTQPFKLDYTILDSKSVQPMSALDQYWMIDLAGVNERDNCSGQAERLYRVRISDEQTRALHSPPETRIAVPTPVTFMLDRDPARQYEFGNFALTEAP